jgi:hypothetical protein
VYGVFVAFAAAFVVLSAWQLVIGVFGAAEAQAPAGEPIERTCAAGLRELARALDRAVAAGAAAGNAHARTTMNAALAPEWDAEPNVAAACQRDRRGADAWATLLRLRKAEEMASERRAAVVAPLRTELETLLAGSPSP